VFPAGGAEPSKIAAMVTADDEKLRAGAIRVAGVWRDVDARGALMSAVESPDSKPAVRQAAITALVDLGGESADFFRKLDTPTQSFDVRVATLVGLASLDLPDAAKRSAALLAAANEKSDPSRLLAGLLKRDGGGDALATALAGKRLPPAVAMAALRHVESTGRDEAKLATLLRNATGSPSVSAKLLTKEELAKKVADVQRYGDAARGEMIFRRADTGCFKCHAIQGAGGQLGPDLGSIGASSPTDYLIESLIEPNKAIKDGYDSLIVKTKDNDVHSGIKVAQDDTQMILRDAVQDRIIIPLDAVRSQRPGGSLMPTGLIDQLPSWEQINLMRFLAELGKPGPFQPGNPMVVRRWRVLPAADAEKVARDATVLESPERAAALPWTPAYSLVSGDLPADTMAAAGQSIAFVRAEIDVTAPGRIGVRVGDAAGLTLWVDATPQPVRPEMEIELPRGQHVLTFKVDVATRGAGLRVELRDVPRSKGAGHPVGGR
jgi:putative heme-binding domain-containing protein